MGQDRVQGTGSQGLFPTADGLGRYQTSTVLGTAVQRVNMGVFQNWMVFPKKGPC